MWLTDIFTGGQSNHVSAAAEQTRSASEQANTARVNQQIRGLTPGQTLQGEIVSRNGGEVQIKVGDDMVLNARVDQNINLEVGKNMTFEVRNNGRSLTLSPLFANTATETNALKALDMASLPVNQDTVSMTGLMMQAGLSIDRNSLQQMFREVNLFGNAHLSDIVDLHKLNLPVNEENLAQVSSYKNLTHQLVDGMHTVMDSLPETMQNMVREGDWNGAGKMLEELLLMVQELSPEEMAGEAQQTEAADGQGAVNGAFSEAGMVAEDTAAQELLRSLSEEEQAAAGEDCVASDGGQRIPGSAQESEQAVSARLMAAAESGEKIGETDGIVSELREILAANGMEKNGAFEQELQQLSDAVNQGDISGQAKVLQQILQRGLQENRAGLVKDFIGGQEIGQFLKGNLSKLWTIEPKDVADSKKVEELYQRLDRQLRTLEHALERGNQTESNSFKAVTDMRQNIDFLQQINQAYTYVQLPLRLQQGAAHGDLYVYTNKRNLAAKDGQISALLHLDMEHLGPVDVYVAMQQENVSTRFYVQDDEMLDFLEAHMDLLTSRLQKRGYHCSFQMQIRNAEEPVQSGLKGLEGEQGAQPLAQYAFDVRA